MAEVKNHPELETLKRNYHAWLMETKQEEKAAELKEREGDYLGAMDMYIKSGLAARAAHLALNHDELASNTELMNRIAQALMRAELFEKAGEVYERIRNSQEAMRCYRKVREHATEFKANMVVIR